LAGLLAGLLIGLLVGRLVGWRGLRVVYRLGRIVRVALASGGGFGHGGGVNFRALRNAFISGLLLLAPVSVTLFVLNFLITSMGRPASGWFFFYIDSSLRENPWIEVVLNLVSTALVLVFITLFGWFSSLLIGKFFLMRMERFVSQVPLVRNVYQTVKQIIDTFSQNKKAVFQRAVLVEYPRKGSMCWAL
jgi:uncharacterized membrane protein